MLVPAEAEVIVLADAQAGGIHLHRVTGSRSRFGTARSYQAGEGGVAGDLPCQRYVVVQPGKLRVCPQNHAIGPWVATGYTIVELRWYRVITAATTGQRHTAASDSGQCRELNHELTTRTDVHVGYPAEVGKDCEGRRGV